MFLVSGQTRVQLKILSKKIKAMILGEIVEKQVYCIGV